MFKIKEKNKGEILTKTDFRELEKENNYIKKLLDSHREAIEKKLELFFESLSNELKDHGFMCCVHTHYSTIKITVYDGTEEESHKLDIQDFEITDYSNNFPSTVMDIVAKWLQGVEA